MDRLSKRIPDERRRQVLAAGSGITLSLLTGCVDLVPWGGLGESAGTDEAGTTPSTQPDESTPGMAAAEIHVVGLHYKSGESASAYEFHVTLKAPKGGDVGADWWQVETLTGERIARKTFSEPRGSRFNTSKGVEVPEDVNAVVVRGHGPKAGYGGQVMLADLEAGKIVLELQGPEPESFEGYTF